jgi:hypothetical protein
MPGCEGHGEELASALTELLDRRKLDEMHEAAVALGNVAEQADHFHGGICIRCQPEMAAFLAAKAALEPKPEPDWIDRTVDACAADWAPQFIDLSDLKRRLREAQP